MAAAAAMGRWQLATKHVLTHGSLFLFIVIVTRTQEIPLQASTRAKLTLLLLENASTAGREREGERGVRIFQSLGIVGKGIRKNPSATE